MILSIQKVNLIKLQIGDGGFFIVVKKEDEEI
jgi:hypothetical protein